MTHHVSFLYFQRAANSNWTSLPGFNPTVSGSPWSS